MNAPTIRQNRIATEIVSSILEKLGATGWINLQAFEDDDRGEVFEPLRILTIGHLQRSDAEELSLEIATEIVSSILEELKGRKVIDREAFDEEIKDGMPDALKTLIINSLQRSEKSEKEKLNLEQEEALQNLYKAYSHFSSDKLDFVNNYTLDKAFINAMKVLEPERYGTRMLEIRQYEVEHD